MKITTEKASVIIAVVTLIVTVVLAVFLPQVTQIIIPTTITQTSTATPTPTITQAITITPTATPTPKSTDGIDQLPPIEWGIMETYFDIRDTTLGEAEYTDVLGRVYVYDSINFIAEAKRSFYAIIIFEAEFYDEDGIKVYSSFVDFDPDYDQWQSGDRSKGYLELPGTSDMKKVRSIKISQFA